MSRAAIDKFNLIVIDPPWPLKKTGIRHSRPNQGVSLDYPTMEVAAIMGLPIQDISENDCYLFLWTTQKFLQNSFTVMHYWGFKYSKLLTWNKQNGICLQGFHHISEFVLFGYKGAIETFKTGKAIPTVFNFKPGVHSEKPNEFYSMVSHLGDKRLDMFARKERVGWSVYGNEVNNSIQL